MNKRVKAQDVGSTCTVKLRCVRATTVAVGRQKLSHILGAYLAIGIYHAMHMRRIISYVLSGSTAFFHIIS